MTIAIIALCLVLVFLSFYHRYTAEDKNNKIDDLARNLQNSQNQEERLRDMIDTHVLESEASKKANVALLREIAQVKLRETTLRGLIQGIDTRLAVARGVGHELDDKVSEAVDFANSTEEPENKSC